MDKTVADVVRQMENDYKSGSTLISAHVNVSLREDIERIEAYINSKHISGDKDSLGREKPFFNIVTAARNIWYRATDIDRANIRIKATKDEDMIAALLATVWLQWWMRKTAFGTFLNDWGRALATYGSSVLKFVKKGGELVPNVVSWNRLICDAIDFENNPKIEVLWRNAAQLHKEKTYDQKKVKEYLADMQSRKDLSGNTRDTNDNYLQLYEVHGEFSLAELKRAQGDEPVEGDEDEYVQQMQVMAYLANKDGTYSDYVFFAGREDDPYMITHLIKEDGYVLSTGAVKSLFDAQWMVNHSQKIIKDQLDLASKMVLQSADETFIGRNVLTNIETGDILFHKANMPLTPVQFQTNVEQVQRFSQAWEINGQTKTGTPDSLRGETPPSGTAWHTVELITQQSQSLFELMTENKGLHIEEMLRRFIIPYIKTKLDTKEEIVATLDAENIRKIDAMYIPNAAIRGYNAYAKDAILNGAIPSPFNQQAAEQGIMKQLAQKGSERTFSPDELSEQSWKEVFKDLEWDVEVEVTGEASDKKTMIESLNTAFKTVAALAGRPMTPIEKFTFNKIMETSGAVSPVQLAQVMAEPQPEVMQGARIPTPQTELVGGSNGGGLPTQ